MKLEHWSAQVNKKQIQKKEVIISTLDLSNLENESTVGADASVKVQRHEATR